MKIKDVLARYQGFPIGQSITPVSRALATAPVLVAVKSPTPDDLRFQVAADNQGLLWIYAFTDQEEFSKVFPAGGSFAEMSVANLLETIGPDEQVGGVFINSKSAATYVLPRELFGKVYQLVQKQR